MKTDDITPVRTAALSARGVSKTYKTGNKSNTVIRDLSLELYTGEITSLVGPSGVGKTTLLRCLAGLTPVSSGSVWMGDREVSEPTQEIALVFQDYRGSLLPWMDVMGNVMFPLQGRGVAKPEREKRALASLERVGLGRHIHDYPWQLSGGMQQRVAIARALAYDAPVMLMDEPFGSLDAQTRFDLEELVLELRRELGITIIVVTHDIDEAVFLSDRVVVFGGRPSTVVDDILVPLGDGRNQVETKVDPLFAELRTKVLLTIKENGIPSAS